MPTASPSPGRLLPPSSRSRGSSFGVSSARAPGAGRFIPSPSIGPLAVVVVALALVGVGCGGVVSPAEEPTAHAPAESAAPAPAWSLESTAGALVALDQAELRLEGALAAPAGDGGIPGPWDPTPVVPYELSEPRAGAPLAQGPPGPDRCAVACEALESMQRAAARLCELLASDDPRCARAAERLERARSLVRAACPRCVAAAR